MSRTVRRAAFLALAAALVAGCGDAEVAEAPGAATTPAADTPAITGTLTYRLAGDRTHRLPDPVHGVCVAFEDAVVSLDNATDATAHLRDGCDGPEGDVVIPGATWEAGEGQPARAVVMLRH